MPLDFYQPGIQLLCCIEVFQTSGCNSYYKVKPTKNYCGFHQNAWGCLSGEFKDSLSYVARPCLKRKKKMNATALLTNLLLKDCVDV